MGAVSDAELIKTKDYFEDLVSGAFSFLAKNSYCP